MMGVELLILAGVLAVGGGVLGRYARVSPPIAATQAVVPRNAIDKPWPTADILAKSTAVLPIANMSADPAHRRNLLAWRAEANP